MPVASIFVVSMILLFGFVYITVKVCSLLFHEIPSYFMKGQLTFIIREHSTLYTYTYT